MAKDENAQFVQLSDGSIIRLKIMDTAGQERFYSIFERYYSQADCCLLVYDITSRISFEKVKNYFIEKIKEKCQKDVKVILLGNKSDLEDQREVSQDEGKDLADENRFIFMESSCKDNYNVSDAFTTLVEMTNNEYNKFNKIKKSYSFVLNKNKKALIESNKSSNNAKCC